MLGPFAFLKLGPIRRAREAFAVGSAELELHRETAFAERWVFLEREAFLELHLVLWSVPLVSFQISCIFRAWRQRQSP